MFERILVPLDGSLLAEQAIPHAERFARIFGSSIVLLRVLEVSSENEHQSPIDPVSWQIRKAEADLYMQEVVSRIRDHLCATEECPERKKVDEERVEYTVLEGRIAENIIDFAHNKKIDLLVISSHGSGGLSRWGMSSVIQKVLDLVYLSVLIIRSYNQQDETADQIHYKHVLLPIDSSRRAEYALFAATILARGETSLELESKAETVILGTENPSSTLHTPNNVSLKPKLFFTAVITPPEIPIPRPYPAEITKLSDQLLQVSRNAVQSYLSEMKRRLLPVDSEIQVVESNNVSSAIEELANQANVDLVLMCAHGYSGQFTHPYGSITRNYIEHGSKSILVIQDVPRSQVRPSEAATADEKSRAYYKMQKDRPEFAYQYSSTSDRHYKREARERNP
jgi:nucleotide-binding universal stress UspA family protein